jgi:hypothetical protein
MECMKVYFVSEHLSTFDKWEGNSQCVGRANRETIRKMNISLSSSSPVHRQN